MNHFVEMLQSSFGSSIQEVIANKTGSDTKTVDLVLKSFLPLAAKALAKNATSKDGSSSLLQALEKDHDGGVLENVMNALSSPQQAQGMKILNHIFGSRLNTVTQFLSKSTQADAFTVEQILSYASPIVMGVLARQSKAKGLNTESLPNFLDTSVKQAQATNPKAMGMVSQILDQDGDGSITDDLMGHGLKYFQNWLQ